MKNIVSIILLLISPIVFAQQNSEAENILDKFNSNLNNSKGLSARIALTIENKQTGEFTTLDGSIKLKQEKYFVDINDMQIISDGDSRWVYMPDVNEVTLSLNEDSEDDILNNPFLVLSSYKEKFKTKLVSTIKVGNENIHIIELYPKNLDESYHTISIRISKNNLALKSVRYKGKDGVHYLIDLNNFESSELSDQDFSFNASAHPDVEIIDLR